MGILRAHTGAIGCIVLTTDSAHTVACDCHENGTDGDCDRLDGRCACLPNALGSRCDQCEPDFWGLNLGPGCIPCDCCTNGSLSSSCDQVPMPNTDPYSLFCLTLLTRAYRKVTFWNHDITVLVKYTHQHC